MARRLYVVGDSAKKVAKGKRGNERWVYLQARTAIPALISEQAWTVKDIFEKFDGNFVPLEMRQEVVKLHKTYGAAKAKEMTGVSVSSLFRWSNGHLGMRGALKMGKLPWARIEGGDPVKPQSEDEPTRPKGKDHKPNSKNKHKRQSHAYKEEIVHRVTNGGEQIKEVSEAEGITVPGIYAWRRQILGLANGPQFTDRAKALAKKFVIEARASDQINGAPVGNLITTAQTMLSDVVTGNSDAREVKTMEALSSTLATLDAQVESLGKDRRLIAQEMEIQQLRRQLSVR